MRHFLAGLAFLFGLSVSAQTLMVSDVDDTIKVAHVPDFLDSAKWAFKVDSRFAGMTHLFGLIKEENPDLHLVYLSNAPSWLMGNTHKTFLERGLFPEGLYINRTNYSKEFHKLMNLRALITKIRPKRVVLVGDNGERDPMIYAQIAEEFKNQGIEFYQYIRILYPKAGRAAEHGAALLENQIGFVSPLEVSLELEKAHLLSSESVSLLIENLAVPIMKQKPKVTEGEVAFPSFVKCRDFVWKWDESLSRFPILEDFKKHLVARCQIRP